MKIVDMLLDGDKRAFFQGLPMIDISSTLDACSELLADFRQIQLRPPFDDCVLVGKKNGFGEFAVRISACALEDDTISCWCSPYWVQSDGKPHSNWSWSMSLSPGGQPCGARPFYAPQFDNKDFVDREEFNGRSGDGCFAADEVTDALGAFDDSFYSTLFALTLLNCKNVHAREQPCSPKLAKRYQERRGHKRPRYYVLDIEPMRKVFRDANGGQDGISLAKALHICRGHFKDYREKPLFGKTKGLFWWQPHVRGDAGAGVVDKDYRIKLPSDGEVKS